MSTVYTESPLTALRRSPFPALRRLTVEESQDRVKLVGSVPSYYLKQLAQETVLPLLGGRQLLNLVSVESLPLPLP
jgi:hypothetical protein